MDKIAAAHLVRLQTSVLKRFTAANIAKWIVEKTKLAMQPYSFVDHEYQERILNEQSQEVNVRKCSQVGVSEVSARKGLALTAVLQPYTVAYTLPTANFAGLFMRTRVDPIINDCEELKFAVNKNVDSSEAKQFGASFLFLKGAASTNAPISTPCDHLIHDELDFCDQEVIGQYISRLTHSKWKKIDRFSTPTLPDFGIDREFQKSRRHFLFCKCDHCNHQFIPDYYKHVRIPDYTGDLERIDKHLLTKIRWEEAQLHCPSCGKVPSLQPQYREWVCENPDEKFVAAGLQVSPFDAPNIIKPSYLVQTSTKYDRVQDFHNFNLGLPSSDREATLTREDFANAFVRSDPPRSVTYVMGVDVGSTYWFVIAAVDAYGDMFIVHTESCPMGEGRNRYHALQKEFQVIATVMDHAPHAETVMALQTIDPNLYAGVYTRVRGVLTHVVVDKEENREEGKEFVRQVNINRNRALDAYMNFVREGKARWRDSDSREQIIGHHLSMKRVKVFDGDNGEMAYSWQKTDGVDHLHHAHLYAWIAGRLRGVARPLVALPGLHEVRKFSLKPKLKSQEMMTR